MQRVQKGFVYRVVGGGALSLTKSSIRSTIHRKYGKSLLYIFDEIKLYLANTYLL